MRSTDVQTAIVAYVQDYVRRRSLEGATREALAKELGCTHSNISHYLNPEKYPKGSIGPQMQQAVADREFDGSIDALKKAALELVSKRDQVQAREKLALALGYMAMETPSNAVRYAETAASVALRSPGRLTLEQALDLIREATRLEEQNGGAGH